MVNPISPEPISAALSGGSPASRQRRHSDVRRGFADAHADDVRLDAGALVTGNYISP
jgi:hypothetical protein